MRTRFLDTCNLDSPKGLRLALLAIALLPTLRIPSEAQTFNTLYAFTGESSAYPTSLTKGRDSKLYGAASGQSVFGFAGEAFDVTTAGNFVPLHLFDVSHGSDPTGGVLLSTDGAFYGTTPSGGSAGQFGYGVLYRLTPSGQFAVIHNFAGGAEGAYPFAPPIEASDGNLYGTTAGAPGFGSTIYRYDSSGNFTTLVQLQQSQGANIVAPLVQGSDGDLYGVAQAGGTQNCGSIFKLTSAGTLLYARSFPCGFGGSYPNGPLVQAPDGNFYGTTDAGGSRAAVFGTIFRMTPAGVLSRLHNFQGAPNDGAYPIGPLTLATDGNLYGATPSGGASYSGSIFKISTSGAYTQLYSFNLNEAFGAGYALIQDTSGLLYGTSQEGGPNGVGTVYSFDMGFGPFITFVLPSGKVAQEAQILGQGLTGATSVTFNGTAASFSVTSDTFMTAVVPSGATTGKVVVTTPGGTLTSNVNFRILQ
jgi:uncharacterized repeat protein (TIGR03803 family)